MFVAYGSPAGVTDGGGIVNLPVAEIPELISALGDVDGNGRAAVGWVHPNSSSTEFVLWRRGAPLERLGAFGGTALGDMDGDGVSDLAINGGCWIPLEGMFHQFSRGGPALFANLRPFPNCGYATCDPWDPPVDLNDDGYADRGPTFLGRIAYLGGPGGPRLRDPCPAP